MISKRTAGKPLLIPCGLLAAGFLGNYFPIPLFFGADFVFGSIAVLLVLYFYGFGWGMLAAVVAHSYTYFLWGHPYGFVNFVGEALFVAILLRKGYRNLVGVVGLFWLVLGMPLVYLEHGIIMGMDLVTVAFIMLKQSINGVFNALLAGLFIHHLSLGKFIGRRTALPDVTLREFSFNVLVAMVLIPALFLTMVQIRYEKEELESQAVARVHSLSTNLQARVHSWYLYHLQAVKGLAFLAAKSSAIPSPGLQRDTEMMAKNFPELRTMHVENAHGCTIAFAPRINERGTSNLGLDFSGRDWIQEAKAGSKPIVSGVFMGRSAVLSPIVNIVVPVTAKNHFAGCGTGTLDLTTIQTLLRSTDLDRAALLTLTDGGGRVIASTEAERKPMELWDRRKAGVSRSLGGSIYLWQPDQKGLPSMTRWRQSSYVRELIIGPDLPWKLTVEAPVAPLQQALYTAYVKNLSVMACLTVLALVLSHVLSRGLTGPLSKLARISADWPEKIRSGQEIEWPASQTLEVRSLVVNFESMTKALAVSFRELRNKGDELERINRELAQEIEERRQTEEALRESEEEAHRLSQESEIIAEIGRTISSTLNIDDVYEKFAGQVSGLIPLDGIGIARINDGASSVTNSYVSGLYAPDRQNGNTFPLSGTVAEMVMRTGAGMIVRMDDRNELEVADPSLLPAYDVGIRTRMVVPLYSRDQVIGSMDIRSTKSNAYSERDLKVAESIASQVAGAVASARLYSDLKQAEEALRYSEEKYRAVVDSSLVGFCIIQDGVLKFVNKRFCNIFGYPEEELSGGMDALDPVHADDRERVREMVQRRLEGGIAQAEHEFRVTRKDGVVTNVKAFGVATVYGGRPAVASSIIDVTREKALESQFFHAQKMEAIGVLAGGIAHDFNNILMTILGYTSLMLMDADPQNTNYEQLQIIEKQVQSGAELTKQLLGFARGGKYEIKTTDLNELLAKSTAMFGRTKKEIRIHGRFGEDLWSVEVDRGQMEQVFLNLFVNAWQAMPGGGDLYLETMNIVIDDPVASIGSLKQGKYVKISVSDTGIGMDDVTRQRIFEPFFTTKAMGRGAGLGLATVYGIIKNHGGAINVYSEKGKGTTFNVYLPSSDKAVVEERREAVKVQKGAETILLVDDQDAILGVGRVILDKLGYKVLTALSGEEAAKTFQNNKDRVDLVILDMIMPGMSGQETYVALKEINPGVKVLLSSGYSMNEQAASVMEQGCNGFIQKPFNVPDLSKKIREVLG